jgi:F-type H+-transporting ATPase subunit epsilon
VALPTHLELQIVTPERMLVLEGVDEVQIPGANGYFGVLPGHTPLLAALAVGELWYRKGQDKVYLSIARGFVEVLPERVTVLAQLAEKAQDIDVARAEAAKARAQERLVENRSEVDYERARVALMKAMTRLQVSSRVPGGARVGELKRMRETRG